MTLLIRSEGKDHQRQKAETRRNKRKKAQNKMSMSILQ